MVLGSGCATCRKLHETVVYIVGQEKIDAEVKYSDDVTKIAELGLMRSPVLVIDGVPVDIKSDSEADILKAIREGENKSLNSRTCFCGGCR